MKGFQLNGRRNNLSDLVIPKLMDDQGRLLIYFSKKIFLHRFDSHFLLLYLTTSMKKEIDNDMDGYFYTRKLN